MRFADRMGFVLGWERNMSEARTITWMMFGANVVWRWDVRNANRGSVCQLERMSWLIGEWGDMDTVQPTIACLSAIQLSPRLTRTHCIHFSDRVDVGK